MATLEQFATDMDAQGGGGTSPEDIQGVVDGLRQTHPGQSDDQIIASFNASQAQTSPVAPPNPVQGQDLGSMTPAINDRGGYASGPADNGVAITPKPALPNNVPAAETPMGRADMFRQANEQISKNYGAEAEQKAVDQGRSNNVFNDAGRSASLGLRAMAEAGGATTRVLDQDYKEQSAKANRPVEDFQRAKAAAQASLEAQLRAGDIDAADVKNQMNALGLKIAQEEYSTKATAAVANNDPNSATTAAKRALAKAAYPELGDRVDKLTGAQISAYFPGIEKTYDARLAQAGKLALQQAKGAAGGVKTSDQIRATLGAQKIDEAIEKDRAALDGTNHAIDLVNEAKHLISGHTKNEKGEWAVGADGKHTVDPSKVIATGTVAGKAAQMMPGAIQSPERQRLTQLTAELTNALLNAAKGAQTDKDRAALETITSTLGQADPGPGIKSAIEFLEAAKIRQFNSIKEGEERKRKMEVIGGGANPYQGGGSAPSTRASNPKAVTSKEAYDALPSGATFVDGNGKSWTKP